MGLLRAFCRGVFAPGQIMRAGLEGFTETLYETWGKVVPEEAFIRAGQEAWGRVCEALMEEEEVAWEQAPGGVSITLETQSGEEGVVVREEFSEVGEEEVVLLAVAEVSYEVGQEVVGQGEEDVSSAVAEGVSHGEAVISERDRESVQGERSVSQLRSLCEELAALVGAEPSEILAAAELELEMAEVARCSAAAADQEPPHSHQEEAHQALTASVVHTMAPIQGGGIFSADSYALPDTLDDVFSGPFEHEALPSPRNAPPPSLVTPLRDEARPQPAAAPPTHDASSETAAAAPPLEQDFALPDSLGECLPAEVHADLHRAAEMGDAETEAAAAAYAQAAEEEAPQTWDAEPEAAAAAHTQAAEEEALQAQQMHEYQRRYMELMQNMPAEFASLARCVSYYPEEALHVGGQLGEGGQGKVFGVRAYDSSGAATNMALKVASNSGQEGNLYTEAYHLIMCLNSRVMRLCGFTLIGGVTLGLLFQLADADIVWPAGEQSTPEQLSYIVKQLKEVAAGLVFVHGEGYLYNDLKPENVLLVNGLAKIADLGLMCRQEDGHLREGAGTPGYIAPEVGWYKCNTKAGDVFAFGMFIHSVVTNTRPFYEIRDQEALKAHLLYGGRFPWPASVRASAAGRGLITIAEACWSQEFMSRPSMEMVLLSLEGVSAGLPPC